MNRLLGKKELVWFYRILSGSSSAYVEGCII